MLKRYNKNVGDVSSWVQKCILNGDLNEIIFMEQPDGQVLKGKEEFVCKL